MVVWILVFSFCGVVDPNTVQWYIIKLDPDPEIPIRFTRLHQL